MGGEEKKKKRMGCVVFAKFEHKIPCSSSRKSISTSKTHEAARGKQLRPQFSIALHDSTAGKKHLRAMVKRHKKHSFRLLGHAPSAQTIELFSLVIAL